MFWSVDCLLILLIVFEVNIALGVKSVIKNVVVKEGKLKFKCNFKLKHTDTTVNMKQSSAVCTPGSPKNKGPFDVSIESGEFHFTISLKINPEKFVSASVTLAGNSGSGSGPESGPGSGQESGSGSGSGYFCYSPWGEWSDCFGCSNTSLTERSRVETEKKLCNGLENLTEIEGWSSWSHWSSCSRSFGWGDMMPWPCEPFDSKGRPWNEYGLQSRKRICIFPEKDTCEGYSTELRKCNEFCCIDNTVSFCQTSVAGTFNALMLNFRTNNGQGLTIKKFSSRFSCNKPSLTDGEVQLWSFGLHQPSVSYFDSKVYICGGYYQLKYGCGQSIGRLECAILDPLSEKWTLLEAKLNIPRYMHVTVALGDTLYVMGGNTPSFCYNDQYNTNNPREVEKYRIGESSFQLEEWSLLDLGFGNYSFPQKLCSLAMGDKLILGGYDRIIRVGVDGFFTKLPNITYPQNSTVRGWACAVVDSRLIVVSLISDWENEENQTLQTNILDEESMTWENVVHQQLHQWQAGRIRDMKTVEGVPVMVFMSLRFSGYTMMMQWEDEIWIDYPAPISIRNDIDLTYGRLEFVPVQSENLNQHC